MKSICVYCGSSPGASPEYAGAAREMGQLLAGEDIKLVYGGGHTGLMGAVADAVLHAGGHVTGVIPESLMERELGHQNVSELLVVKTMHERKALMAELAGGFIALPGGFGTLEELLEILTWAQLDMHHKPCGLLNTAGFYDPLLQMFQHARDEEFLSPRHYQLLHTDETCEGLLAKLRGAF